MAFSPNGGLLASGRSDGMVRIWHLATQGLRTALPCTNEVLSLSFSPDGSLLAVSETRHVLIWDLAHDRVASSLNTPMAWIAFAPVLPWLAVAGPGTYWGHSGGAVRLWNYETRQWVMTLPESGSRVAFSPDGSLLATANWGGAIKIWRLADGHLVRTIEKAGGVCTIEFSPDGTRLLTTNGGLGADLWDVESGRRVVSTPPHSLRISAAAFSPNGTTIAVGGFEQTIFLHDLPTLKLRRSLYGHGNEIDAMAFSPNGRLLASAGKDNSVMLWNPNQPDASPVIHGVLVEPWSRHPVFSTDGNLIAGPGLSRDTAEETLTSNGPADRLMPQPAVVVWRTSDQQVTATYPGEDFPLAFTRDGSGLITVNDSVAPCILKRWDLQAHKLLKVIPLAETRSRFRTVPKLSPDERWVAGWQGSKESVWNMEDGKRLLDLPPGNDLAFSPDGSTLATSGPGNQFTLWHLPDGSRITSVSGHRNNVYALAFSADGTLLVSGSIDSTAMVWDTTTHQLRATLRGHRAGVIRVALAPDSRTLATYSDDHTIRLWCLRTFREVATLRPEQRLWWISFSTDGQWLAGAGEDRTLRFWHGPLKTDENRGSGEVARLCAASAGSTPPRHTTNDSTKVDTLAAPHIPKRDSAASPNLLDLSPYYNAGLNDDLQEDHRTNNLASLQSGVQALGGVEFDVRGVVQLAGAELEKRSPGRFPKTVTNIPVAQTFRRLHCLHGTAWKIGNGEDVGNFILHYADGEQRRLPVKYGEHVLDWWSSDDPKALSHAVVAWTGMNEAVRSISGHLQLHRATWENPRPDVAVKSIDYVSTMTKCAPFLIAITVEP